MKQTIKKIVSILVVLCLSMSMLMLVACKPKPEQEGEKPGDNSGEPSVQVTVDDIKFEDRANYNAENVETAYMENSVYDLMYTPDTTASKNMKGYLLGDVYNMVIEQAKMVVAQDPSLAGVKLDIFTFSRDTQGNWRNYNKAEVHPIMNKLFNYKVDSDEGFALTQAELNTYGNVKLFALLRESVANTKIVYENTTVSEGNTQLSTTLNQTLDSLYASLSVPMVKQTLDATVADFTKLVAGTAEEQITAFNKLYGAVKAGELATMFGTTLPAEVNDMPLSKVAEWLDTVNKAGGFDVYINQMYTQMMQTVMPMKIGEVMKNFGVVLPTNLASYTVQEVVAELQAMIAPQPAPAPAPMAEGDGTGTTTETEEPQKSFVADLMQYLNSLTIPVSDTVTLQGQELVGFVQEVVGILTAKYEGTTTLEQFDAMLTALNTFVTEYDARITEVVTALDNLIIIPVDSTTTVKPSQALAVVKDFLAKGDTYKAYTQMLTTTTVEQFIVELYMLPEGSKLSETGVKKVDDFVNKYKVMKLADFINGMATFQQELTALENSLTLSEELALSNYNYLAENTAVKAFMEKYGDMTQTQINEKNATDEAFAKEYAEATITLLKNLKVKDFVPQADVA